MALRDISRGYADRPISPQTRSVVSILAIISAIASFFVAHAALKFSLAFAAALLGVVGLAKAASPRVSGGILSITAMVLAGIGLLVALLDAVGIL